MTALHVNNVYSYIQAYPSYTGILTDDNKTMAMYLNGELHCETGPAFFFFNNSRLWCLNGKEYSEQDWKIAVRKMKLEKVLKRIEG